MDFRFSGKEEAFRKEVLDFLEKELPPAMRAETAKLPREDREWSPEFARKVGKRGWLALGLPREYGGQARSAVEQLIFYEEMAYARAPINSSGVATRIVAPSLVIFGTDEQRREFLPSILSGDASFCLGYSEPGAGSDLASLQTRAVEDGDDYVITGQKMWTTQANRATLCWLGARTDPDVPKHKGISLFIVPMDSPGIRVHPVWCMGGLRTNQVFLDGVRVPKRLLIGEKNRGWYHIATALDLERASMGGLIAKTRRTFADLLAWAGTTKLDGRPVVSSPVVRDRLAELAIEVQVGRLLMYRVIWLLSKGVVPDDESSMTKVFTSELDQRLSNAAVNIIGLYGQLVPGGDQAPLGGEMEEFYEASRMPTFGGGANEIQRTIIATRGLGLPR